MTDADRLRNQLTYSRKQTSYAWANHYKYVETQLSDAISSHRRLITVETEEAIPTHIKEEMKSMALLLKKKWECPICLNMIEDGQLEITSCGHFYCRNCLDQHQDNSKAQGEPKWKCATCRKKHNYKELVVIQRRVPSMPEEPIQEAVPAEEPIQVPVRRRRPPVVRSRPQVEE